MATPAPVETITAHQAHQDVTCSVWNGQNFSQSLVVGWRHTAKGPAPQLFPPAAKTDLVLLRIGPELWELDAEGLPVKMHHVGEADVVRGLSK